MNGMPKTTAALRDYLGEGNVRKYDLIDDVVASLIYKIDERFENIENRPSGLEEYLTQD